MFTNPGDRAGRKRPNFGLLYWTESYTNSTPNAVIPVVAWSTRPALSDVNLDISLIPKGTGAFLAAIPDGGIAGGNKRGLNATDLQTSRLAANQVASGDYSINLGGASNKATAVYAASLGGNLNVASGTASIVGGAAATASGQNAVALGNVVTASGSFSFCTGLDASTRGLYGARAHGTGRQANPNDIQELRMFVRGNTTDATPKVLTADNAAATAANQLAVVAFSNLAITGQVTAGTTNGDTKSWTFSCAIFRQNAASTTAMVAACTPVVIANTAGTAATWTLAVAADATNGALALTFTGAVAASCRICASILSVETGF